MAAIEAKTNPHRSTVVQAVVPSSLAHQLKTRAVYERRSVSSLVRIAIEDKLRQRGEDDPR